MACIITGCVLKKSDDQWVGGDLHLIANAYVFVAIRDDDGDAAWADRHTYRHYNKEIDASGARDFLERGHVIVASESECVLNAAAWEYLDG